MDTIGIGANGGKSQVPDGSGGRSEGLRILARLIARELLARRRQKRTEIADSQEEGNTNKNLP